MPREWKKELAHTRYDAHGRLAYVVRCCRCVSSAAITGDMSPAVAASKLPKQFANRGWLLSNSGRKDYCPACLAQRAIQAAREAGIDPDEVTMSVTPLKPNKARVPVPGAEPPREMGREDSRVIFAKLNEVYVDERVGYGKGWTDDKVATDLGVPRAWVAEVREQHFGPNVSEDAVRVITEGRQILKEMRDLWTVIDRKAGEVAEARSKLSNYTLRLDKLERDVQHIENRNK